MKLNLVHNAVLLSDRIDWRISLICHWRAGNISQGLYDIIKHKCKLYTILTSLPKQVSMLHQKVYI